MKSTLEWNCSVALNSMLKSINMTCVLKVKERKKEKNKCDSTPCRVYTTPWWEDYVIPRFKFSVMSLAGCNIPSASSLCVSQVWHMRQFGLPVSPIWAQQSRRRSGHRHRVSSRVFTWVWAAAAEPWWEESLSTILVWSEGLDWTPVKQSMWSWSLTLIIHTFLFPVCRCCRNVQGNWYGLARHPPHVLIHPVFEQRVGRERWENLNLKVKKKISEVIFWINYIICT